MPEKDELDVLLDSALATYADPGPDSGLERRVLAALAAERAPGQERGAGRARWMPWVIAVPVAASLLLWLLIPRNNHSPSVQTEVAHRSDQVQRSSTITAAPSARSDKRKEIHPSGAKALVHFSKDAARLKPCPFKTVEGANCAPLPKLDVFPTPQAMTPQEQALVSATTEAPVPLRKALVEAQEDAPVHIAAIHIPPVEPLIETQR